MLIQMKRLKINQSSLVLAALSKALEPATVPVRMPRAGLAIAI